MTIPILVAILAILAVVAIRFAIRGNAAAITDPEQLLGRTQPVDLAAFQNLISVSDENYLRASLPWNSYLRIHRLRCRAARQYVAMASANAAVFVRLGQYAQHSPDEGIRSAGAKLLALALNTRMYAIEADMKLRFAELLPWWQPSLNLAAATYTDLRKALALVVQLQRPELAGRIYSAV
ncbi:MAG: hypothetical protein ACR2IF_15450 [Terriglobales bacterium]